MRKRFKQIFAALCCLSGCSPAPQLPAPTPLVPPLLQSTQHNIRWAPYYNVERPAEDFRDLDLVVFDRRYHPEFRRLPKSTVILAYVSIGEVYDNVPEKKKLEKANSLLMKNYNWNSHVVDLASPIWRKMVMGYVDNALAQGFDGIMLDTVDSPIEWARANNPNHRKGMQDSAASLIQEIRFKYPDIKIMLNRGFDILPQVATDIDYILAESILTHKDVSSGQYRQLHPKTYTDYVDQLHNAARYAKNIKVMTLDYWDLDDDAGVREIYRIQRDAGFSPYVTTPDLHTYTPEPIRLGASSSRE